MVKVLAGVLQCKRGKLEEAEDFKCIFVVLILCNKIEIDQLQCEFWCVLGNYDRIISDAVEKQNRNGKRHKESIFSN